MRTSLFLAGVVASLLALSSCQPEQTDNRFTGYIEADLIYVSASLPGRIESVLFEQGDAVTKGELLLTLENDAQRISVAQARAQLAQAKSNVENLQTGLRQEELDSLDAQLTEAEASLSLAEVQQKRWDALVKIGATTQANKDQIDAEYNVAVARVHNIESQIEAAKLPARPHLIEAAQAQVAAAQEALNYALWQQQQTRVSAPADATIEQVLYRSGEYVAAGMPVYSLLPADGLKVKFFVPEALLSSVRMGQQVQVKTPDTGAAVDNSLPATVSYIAQDAEFTPPIIYSSESREKLVFLVEASFADAVQLRPGQPVDVVLP
ncbi:HlyD family secretion protein [Reinekea marinisedimentorum]|uniref:HlyD family secretion protein n=1 Tax=Reinekea marinisedimentorum TaxID=230495 RepID=A0A4R3I5B1_9GAMM|nr:HlyD family efflux transporter periplasmic adaptor subunit [Reinekea marinisedimentorum]TCS40452.1 HlyD family secretion protein [Reinekea marinisedimentorum]